MEISQLIKYSPKRSLVFELCKQELSIGGTGLRPLCPTRWTVRTGAISAVINNYPALLQALQTISEISYDDYGRRANGLLTQLGKFDTFFGLKLSLLIFSGTEQTSISLQSKNVSAQEALTCSAVAKSYLRRLRSEESFSHFYSGVVKESETLTEKPTLPRYRRPPRRIDDGSSPHQFESPESYYRSIYYEVLDMLSGEISRRFDQDSLSIPKDIENLLITSSNEHMLEIEIPNQLTSLYSEDIDFNKAVVQLKMLPDIIQSYKASKGLSKLHVTNIRIVAEILDETPMAKNIFTEIHKLLLLYFTIPLTTCTAERSYSSMKTYLRSTMTEKRLNNVMLCHVHKEELDELSIVDICSSFICTNSRRKSYLVNFRCIIMISFLVKMSPPPKSEHLPTPMSYNLGYYYQWVQILAFFFYFLHLTVTNFSINLVI